MAIKTSIPNYDIDITKSLRTLKGRPGYICAFDTKDNLICVDDTGSNVLRINQKATDPEDKVFRGRVSSKKDKVGNSEMIYEVEGEEVRLPLFEFLLTTTPSKMTQGYEILNAKGTSKGSVVLQKPFSKTSTELGVRLNVSRGNLKVIPNDKIARDSYDAEFNKEKELLEQEVAELSRAKAEMTGTNIWLANLENYIKIKIMDIELLNSKFKIPSYTIKGFPEINKTMIIPRLYSETMNIKELGPYFRSFVPEITMPYKFSISTLNSFKIKFKLKGVRASYDTDVVTEEGTLGIRKNKISEDDIEGIERGLSLDLRTFYKFILNGNVYGESKITPPEPVYLTRPSERPYDELINYESARDLDKAKVKQYRINKKFLSLSEEEQDSVIRKEYLKNLGNKSPASIEGLLDKTIRGLSASSPTRGGTEVKPVLPPTAEELAELKVRSAEVAATTRQKELDRQAAERAERERILAINEKVKKSFEGLEIPEHKEDLEEEGETYEFDIS